VYTENCEKYPSKKCEWVTRDGKPCSFKKINASLYCKEHTIKYGAYAPSARNTILTRCTVCGLYFKGVNNVVTQCELCLKKTGKVYCKALKKDGELCPYTTAAGQSYCARHKHYETHDIDWTNPEQCGTCHLYFEPGGLGNYLICRQCRNLGAQNRMKLKQDHQCQFIKDDGSSCTNVIRRWKHGEKYCEHCMKKHLIREEQKRGIYRCQEHGCNDILTKENYTRSNSRICDKCCMFNNLRDYKRKYRRNKTEDRESYEHYKFELTDEAAIKMMLQPCYYCGIQHSYGIGLDRKDNTKCYSVENTVPACYQCNLMKNTHSISDFFKICEHILTYKDVYDGSLHYDLFVVNRRPYRYNEYVYKVTKKRKIPFNLTEPEYYALINGKCEYCGLSSEILKQPVSLGIDRISSEKGYTRRNCVTACNVCNKLKHKFELGNFILQCLMILLHHNIIDKSKIKSKYETAMQMHIKSKHDIDLFNYGKLEDTSTEDEDEEMSNEITNSVDESTTKPNKIKFECNDTIINATMQQAINTSNRRNSKRNQIQDILPDDDDVVKINFVETLENEKSSDIIDTDFKTLETEIIRSFKEDKVEENLPKFIHKNEYYISKMFKGDIVDVTQFKIKLEFVNRSENDPNLDIWNFYRCNISSFKKENYRQFFRNIQILVKDERTDTILGIIGLSSDFHTLGLRDKYIGWNDKMKCKYKRINNIMNITTCVPTHPFGYNFCGGKLLAMLCFSKEVAAEYKRKYGDTLLGLTTTSLYGKSIQYDRLKCLKYLGLTKGLDTHQIASKTMQLCYRFCKLTNPSLYAAPNASFRKIRILQYVASKLHLAKDDIFRGCEKGVYFGFTHLMSQKLLNDKLTDINTQKLDDLPSAQEIFNQWLPRANARNKSLLQRNGFIKTNYLTSSPEYKLTENARMRKREERERSKITINEPNETELITNEVETKDNESDIINTETRIYKPKTSKHICMDILQMRENGFSFTQLEKYVQEKHNIKLSRATLSKICTLSLTF
jgi:hypothetical protein